MQRYRDTKTETEIIEISVILEISENIFEKS